jgi:hypothetical protein
MSTEPNDTKTTDEVRQGTRVKGMTTVLTVSTIAAAAAIFVIALVVANR